MNRTDKCEPKVLTPRALIFKARPDRANYRGNHCDGYALAIDELRFTPSELLIAPEGATDVPPLLVLTNTIFNLTCAEVGEGPEGSSVTIEAGALQTLFDWRTIPGIKADRLAYLSRQSADHDLESTVLGWMEDTELDEAETVELIRGYKLLQAQAQYVYDFLRQALDALQSAAEAAARALIYCFWYNVEQIARCSDLYTDSPLPVPQAFTVVAGDFQSTDGQEEANALAVAYAQSQLECVWENVEQTATCVEDLDFPDAVPGTATTTDTGTTLDPVDTAQAGTSVVAAGVVTSSAGAAAADAEARALAISLLDCFYVNAAVSKDCNTLYNSGEGHTAATALVNLGAANPAIGKKGSSVTLGAGDIISRTSQVDADEMAEVTALALLDCYWENDEEVATCDPEVFSIGGVDYTVGADQAASEAAGGLGAYQATVVAGTFISIAPGGSKEQAQDQAELFATSQLFCMYCNQAVAATCITPYPAIAPPDPLYSLDKTRSISAGVFCSTSASAAQTQAETLAAIPVRSLTALDDELCRYGNRRVVARCISAPEEGISGKWDVGDRDDLDALSDQSLNAEVIISENTMILADGDQPEESEDDVQTYVDNLARQIAISQLDCFWENEYSLASCPDVTPEEVTVSSSISASAIAVATLPSYAYNISDIVLEGGVYSRTYWTPYGGLGPGAVGVAQVPAGMFSSYLSFEEAQALASTLAQVELNCVWSNCPVCYSADLRPAVEADPEADPPIAAEDAVTCESLHGACFSGPVGDTSCDDAGGVFLRIPVPEGMTTSNVSQADANMQAVNLAASLMVCQDDTGSLTQRPTPVHDFPFLLSITRKTTIGGCPTIVESFNLNLSNIGVNGTGASTLDTILALDAGTHTVRVDWKFAPFAGSCFTDEVFDSALHGFEGEALVGLNIRVNGIAPAGYSDSVDVYTVTTIDDGGDRVVESSERLGMSLDMKPPPTLMTDFRIYRKYMTLIEFTYDEAIAGYDTAAHTNWSVQFVVSGSSITGLADPMGVPTMDVGGEELFDGDASAADPQNYYRLPIIRGGKVVCQGGVFRENIMCAGNRGYIVELLRIG